jgi:hypothetical protein
MAGPMFLVFWTVSERGRFGVADTTFIETYAPEKNDLSFTSSPSVANQ